MNAPRTLLRAEARSRVFRDLFPQLAVFPLRLILRSADGVACTCSDGYGCGQIGKHPFGAEVKWLPQTSTQNTLKGDFVWFKFAMQF